MAYKVEKGDVVLIHAAAGGTGQMLVKACKYFGATVIGTASTMEKCAIAKSCGADHVINYNEQDIVEQVLKLTDRNGVHCVMDGVGKSTFETSLKCCRKLGFLLSFGNASGKVADVDVLKLGPKAVRLMRPSLFSLMQTKQDFEYCKWVWQG